MALKRCPQIILTLLCIRYNAMTRKCDKWREEAVLAVCELKNSFIAIFGKNKIKENLIQIILSNDLMKAQNNIQDNQW